MMSGNRSRRLCGICAKLVGACGYGYVSHMRAHVRRGEATEFLHTDWRLGACYEFRLTKAGLKLYPNASRRPIS